MAKRGPTRAQRALAKADEWIKASEEAVRDAESAWVQARQQLEMHQTIRAVLEKTLTRAPRQPSKPTVGKRGKKPGKDASGMAAQLNKSLQSQRRVTAAEADCAQCDYDGDHNIHHLESVVGYHPFQPAPSAASQSSPNNGAASSEQLKEDASTSAHV